MATIMCETSFIPIFLSQQEYLCLTFIYNYTPLDTGKTNLMIHQYSSQRTEPLYLSLNAESLFPSLSQDD